MRVLPELPARSQRVMDVIFRVALLLLMAGVAFHAVVGEPDRPAAADQPPRHDRVLSPRG